MTAETIYWSEKVLIDGVDQTSILIGDIEINAEENGNGIASLTLIPPGGALNLEQYRGKTLKIYYETRDAAGALISTAQLFDGLVSTPIYNPAEGTIRIDGTDNRDDKINALSSGAVDALTPGAYVSDHVQGTPADSFERAQFRLQSLPGAIDCTPAGALAYTVWAAKISPDVTLTDDDAMDAEYQLDIKDVAQLINKIVITIGYRRVLQYHAQIAATWAYTLTICQYLAHPTTVPNKETIRQACEALQGWMLKALAYQDFHPSGTYSCPSPLVFVNNPQNQIVKQADATFVRRWNQTVDKTITITVQSDESIAAHGERKAERQFSFSIDVDEEAFEGTNGDNKLSTAYLQTDGTPSGVGSINRALDPPAGSVLDPAIPAYVLDRGDAAAESNTVQTVIAVAYRDITEQLRDNDLSIECDLRPSITVQSTVQFNFSDITAKGKVRKVRHVMREDGDAVSIVTLALSLPGGVGTADSITYPPPAPPPSGAKFTLTAGAAGTGDGTDTISNTVALSSPNHPIYGSPYKINEYTVNGQAGGKLLVIEFTSQTISGFAGSTLLWLELNDLTHSVMISDGTAQQIQYNNTGSPSDPALPYWRVWVPAGVDLQIRPFQDLIDVTLGAPVPYSAHVSETTDLTIRFTGELYAHATSWDRLAAYFTGSEPADPHVSGHIYLDFPIQSVPASDGLQLVAAVTGGYEIDLYNAASMGAPVASSSGGVLIYTPINASINYIARIHGVGSGWAVLDMQYS